MSAKEAHLQNLEDVYEAELAYFDDLLYNEEENHYRPTIKRMLIAG